MILYRAPTETVEQRPPNGEWEAFTCPDLPQWSLVAVRRWFAVDAEDLWDAEPGVVAFYPENLAQLAPLALVNAFASWGVLSTDTIRQALRKIRRHSPCFDL